jgi:hypothetical protein
MYGIAKIVEMIRAVEGTAVQSFLAPDKCISCVDLDFAFAAQTNKSRS